MITLVLFMMAVVFTVGHLFYKKGSPAVEVFLMYLIFFNIGIMGIVSFCAHTVFASETAAQIGWASGSPFQSEIAVANLSYGVLGVLALWLRQLFWVATVIGNSILLLGAYVVHMYEYAAHGDTAPLNYGLFVWINDLVLPLLLLFLLFVVLKKSVRN